MKLENLPIWPRILAANPRNCNAKNPINILRAVISAGGLHQAGPVEKYTTDYRTSYTGLALIDLYSAGIPGLPARQSKCGWPGREVATRTFTDQERAARRAKADPKFRRALERQQAAEQRWRDIILHIAARYHHTVARLYTSRYAGIRYQDSAYTEKDWPYKGEYKNYPREYSGAGAFADASEIRLHSSRGTIIHLPAIPPSLLRHISLSEPHPIGLFAVPVKGQPGVFACMSAKPGDRKWIVAGFCVKGRLVPECVARGTMSISDIAREPNTETRQVMIERFGAERYIREAGATEIHRDDFGTLYDVSGFKVVKVVNSTPEPDGSYKDYYLRVPPHMSTAREAVAWTFGERPESYAPAMQS